MPSTRTLLACITGSFALAGAFDATLPASALPGMTILHGLVVGVLTYMWCRAEAMARLQPPPGRSALFAGVFPLLGLPCYFFRTRPWRRAVQDTSLAAALCVALWLLHRGSAEVAGRLLR